MLSGWLQVMSGSCEEVIRTDVAVLDWARVLTDGQTDKQAGNGYCRPAMRDKCMDRQASAAGRRGAGLTRFLQLCSLSSKEPKPL